MDAYEAMLYLNKFSKKPATKKEEKKPKVEKDVPIEEPIDMEYKWW